MTMQPAELSSLLAVPFEQRDLDWELRFFDSILNSKIEVVNDQPVEGPDGFPYLLVKSPSEKATENAQEVFF